MKTERGSVIVDTDIYNGAKAKLPVLRTVVDVLSLTFIITFIVCSRDIFPDADKYVLILLDFIFGIFGILILLCLRKSVSEFMQLKKFYAEADVKTRYEFFANGVGMYQSRNGKVEDCEVLEYSTLSKKWETKKDICFMANQYAFYKVEKSGLDDDELNAVRAALGLPYTGNKIQLATAKLKIAPFNALIANKELISAETVSETSEETDTKQEQNNG